MLKENYKIISNPELVDIKTTKNVCFTLDLETDHGPRSSNTFAHEYFPVLKKVLNKHNIKLTVFVEGKFIQKKSRIIDDFLDIGSEFELHCYDHLIGPDTSKTLEKSYRAYIKKFKKNPNGYRGFLYTLTEEQIQFMLKNKFKWDSSILPSYRPKVYKSWNLPSVPFYINKKHKFIEIPVSTSPLLKIPFTLSYYLLFGKLFFKTLYKIVNLLPNLIFDFHMHDLFKTPTINQLTFLLKIIYSKNYLFDRNRPIKAIEYLITYLKSRGYKFITMNELYREINP